MIWADDRGTEGGGNNPDAWTDSVALADDFLVLPSPAAQTVCAGTNALIDIDVPSFNGFTNNVTLSVSGQPGGTTTNFSVNPVTPPGSSVLTVGNTSGVSAGTYNLTITGTSGAITHDGNADLTFVTSAPSAPVLTSPPSGSTGVSTSPTLMWNAASGADDYLVEVDDNSNFSSPEYSATVAGTSTVATGLNANTLYFWRVTANNPCGQTVSAVFNFRTALIYCSSPGLSIPDNNPTGVTDTINVPAGGANLLDLDVSIVATHTWVGDLAFTLRHDGGTPAAIYDRPGVPATTFGCSGDDIDVVLDDEAASPVENQCGAGVPSINGTFSPNVALSAYDGQSISGAWALQAQDLAGGDTGTLDEWCLIPDVPVDPMPFLDGFETGDTSQWSSTVN